MPKKAVLETVSDYVGTITFNRPERGNALSPEILFTLHRLLEKWAGEEAVRCVVITGGEGKAFSSGYDIAAIPTRAAPEMAELIKKHNPLELAFSSVKHFPYPTVALLNGHCFGAGLNLAMCCDLRIAAADVKIGMPPAKLGLVYHPAGLVDFILAAGMSATRELFFTGRTYTAEAALDMGLLNHVVAKDEVFAFTRKMAADIADNAPISLKNNKKILNMLEKAISLTAEDQAEAERLQAEGFASEDLQEGQRAFLEKRKPHFKGK
ncbi:MAG: enoyl-CoA hydratase/isomerase family protein [Thermodesulfobacteriota bacterium]